SEADTNGKFAQYTNDLLNKLGTDPASSSWRRYKEVKNGKTQYYVYWTDTEISKLKPGEKVNASRCTLSPEGAVGPIEDVSCSVEEKKASGSTNTKKFNVIGHLK
ncbi:MAG: hypothetical protein RR472_08165, partial [Anaerovoracaceae bacterium]